MVPFKQMLYVPEQDTYFPEDEVPPGAETLDISGTELRRRLQQGARDSRRGSRFPRSCKELRRSSPAARKQGFTVFFTGLSGSGKSTIANVLLVKLLEQGGRPVTMLDGDLVRKNLSSELGFSKEHRDINIRRIGYVASEITKHGGIAICAPIAPYDTTRKDVRAMIDPTAGSFWCTWRRRSKCARSVTARAVCQGAGRHRQGIHRDFRPLRRHQPMPSW